jgi:hypothetical protein
MYRMPLVLLLIFCASTATGALQEDEFPVRIKVQPLFFVPQGQPSPTKEQIIKLYKHVRICQKRYEKMLSGRDTFEIVDKPQVVNYKSNLATLKERVDKQQFSRYLLSQLLGKFKVNRFNCPYVFIVVVMNPKEAWSTASGRTINPGFNSGGGIATFSSIKLDAEKSLFQGSLQHEFENEKPKGRGRPKKQPKPKKRSTTDPDLSLNWQTILF